MRRFRTLIILAALVAIAAAAAVVVQREDAGIAKSGETLLPDLLDELGEVARVESTHQGDTVTLELKDGRWAVADRDGYPAETAEVRGLLVGAAELVRVEPKTSRPEHYEKLELGDPADEEGESFGYVMKDAAGRTVASLVVGKRRFVTTPTDTDEYFVRVADDPQAWLVSGKIPRNRRALDWLRREVIKLDQMRVARASVTHPDGTVVRVAKSSPKETDFTLEGIPEGFDIEEPYSVHAIGTALATFTLNDIEKLDEIDFGAEDGLEAVAETFDGVRLTARTSTIGDKTFVRMAAEFDPGLIASETTDALLDEAAARAEVEELNRRWDGWAFEMSGYTVKNLEKKVDDMVKPIEGEPSGPAPGTFPTPGAFPAPRPDTGAG